MVPAGFDQREIVQTRERRIDFNDESRFQLGSDDNRRHVWRCLVESGNPALTVARHTDPQQGVMVSGTIFFGQKGG
ncbi:hypothetical protein TNCV_2378441 [Trichonephila clavipes]|nr:hypothetical protein TNCV_2378441 [Trichonephila clavipes]